MRTLLTTAVLALAATTAHAQKNLGEPMPVLEAVKWYNTPPLAMEQLQGKAILVEVFRTW